MNYSRTRIRRSPWETKKYVLTEVRLIHMHDPRVEIWNISPKVSSQRHLNITIT